ncbi:unnamed protein product [Ascophyllum nodosum]
MRKAEGRIQEEGLPSFMLPSDGTSLTPFALNSTRLWDEGEEKCGSKRKHEDTLNDEFLAMLKDAGLENMALEVGTVQGGQIAALNSSKEGERGSEGKMSRPFSPGDASSPVAMTASAIFSPNPRGTGPPRESPLLLRRSLGSPAPPESMTASAIFSPGAGGEALSYLAESPAAIKGTDLRLVASAESDTPYDPHPRVKRARKSLAPPAPPRDISPPKPVPPPPPPRDRRKRRSCRKTGPESLTNTGCGREVSMKRVKKHDAKPSKSLPNKGLRHFSVKVCRKVEEKGSTSYNEVADELVRELASEGDYGGRKDAQYDDKNIRRRVYDALNVLMAIDIISKDRKEIKWKGLPESARSGLGALQREKHDLERSLDKKKDQLSELLVQQIAFRNLARRNRLQSAPRAAGGEGAAKDAEDLAASKIHMPFIVVSSSNDTVIQCEMAENREDVFFNFSHEFQIADDNEILKRLGMHKCRKQDLPNLLARELIPQVPEDILIQEDGDRGGSSSSHPSSPVSSCSEYAPS